jgi:transposase
MKNKNRTHSAEFKLEAVKMITIGGRKPTEVARDLGIGTNLLYRWKNKYLESLDATGDQIEGKSATKLYEELQAVRKELQYVTQQRDILKKTVGIFAEVK